MTVGLTGGLTYWKTRVKHWAFIAWPGGGEVPIRLKNAARVVYYKDPTDGKPCMAPLDRAFARTTPKGSMRYKVDGPSGLLYDWVHHPAGFLEMDAKAIGAIAKDNREQKLAHATSAGKWDKLFENMGIIAVVLGVAVVAIVVMLGIVLSKVSH